MTRRKTNPHTLKNEKKIRKAIAKKSMMGKTDRSKLDLGIASTLKAAASITGLPESVIHKAKAQGCRAFTANGRVNCDDLMAFVGTMPQEPSGPDYLLERALCMQETRLLKKQKREQLARELIPMSEVRRDWFRNVVSCKSKFYAAEDRIAVESGMHLGLTSEQIAKLREIIARHNRNAIKELNVGELGRVECPECKKEII